ncbi:MAG: PHP domain-containing protein, partial [Methanosarcinales archaeon]|nr:PHP domain-containing protein [Methanosarcinales archaeon]
MDDNYHSDSILFLRKMKYDLHTHTKYSPRCGIVEPEDFVKMAISKGLDGIAVTDHDTIKGAVAAKRFGTPDFEVIVGCEMKTTNGELIGLYLQEEIISRAPIEVIQEIHDQGGIVVVPHPFDRFRSARFSNISKYLKDIDAIEVFNSRCIS